ncbi:MAG: DUF11 domain-containing protein, partial [Acidobacteriia bacterium]|nr:DUF11 domain-containing protein [Terriglobia bacterium]
PRGAFSCTGSVDTSTPGQKTFTVTAKDSGTNTNVEGVDYTVVPPTDLAILKLAPLKVTNHSTLTYSIGVGDLGPASAANVTITDPLPGGTTLASFSGKNVSCSIVNRRLVCTTTQPVCTTTPNSVSCNFGTLAPLSWWSLNGATLQITVNVNSTVGTVLKNTATVTSTNTDTKLSNNTSTASTQVK